VDYGYTNRNEQGTITWYSDLAGTTQVANSSYTFDDAGRLTGIVTKNSGGTTLSYYNYTFDNADRVSTHTWWSQIGTVTYSGTKTYSYDTTDQLTNDSTTTYTYDLNGNRTMSGYQTGTANRLSNDGTFTYTYDDAGNVSQKSKGSGQETWYYSWDHRNRLSSVRKTSDGTTDVLRVTYTYDIEGQRVQEDKWKSGVGTTTTRFAYDGDDQWADLDGSNAVLVRYVYNDGVDRPLTRTVASGANAGVAIYLTDNLGSVRDLVDSNAAVKDHNDFTGFGSVTEASPGYGDRLKFTAREYDADTGLQATRARWYEVSTGRWFSEDPILFRAGDPNLYRFVGNQPVRLTDPTGLSSINSPAGAAAWAFYAQATGVGKAAFGAGVAATATVIISDEVKSWYTNQQSLMQRMMGGGISIESFYTPRPGQIVPTRTTFEPFPIPPFTSEFKRPDFTIPSWLVSPAVDATAAYVTTYVTVKDLVDRLTSILYMSGTGDIDNAAPSGDNAETAALREEAARLADANKRLVEQIENYEEEQADAIADGDFHRYNGIQIWIDTAKAQMARNSARIQEILNILIPPAG
jgi:RHS repeat-associated protein